MNKPQQERLSSITKQSISPKRDSLSIGFEGVPRLALRVSLMIGGILLWGSSVAYGLELNSSSFNAGVITFMNGGLPLTSANINAVETGIGEGLSHTVELTSTNFQELSGQLTLLETESQYQKRIVISDLIARTGILGDLIPEKTWQKNNAPYFSWLINIYPSDVVDGCSVALDNKPDYEINTTETNYQFPENGIPSGKHTFYVLPHTTKWGWIDDNMLSFEIWVDLEPPFVNQLTPQPDELVTNGYTPISCLLYDNDSGVGLTTTSLTVNGNIVNFSYDPNTRLLKYSPAAALAEGKNSVLLKAYDLAGNYAAKGWDFVVDSQPPLGSVMINGGEEFTHSPYVTLNIKAEDKVSGVKNIYISNDGVFDTELNQAVTYAPVIQNWLVAQPDTDGIKTVYVKFQDFAGNLSQACQAAINLKLLTPNTRIISGPASVTESTDADFKFEASKPGCLFSYKLDNQEWSTWSSSTEAHFTGLAEDNHYFSVKSGYDINGDGNISVEEEDATPSQWVWSIKPKGYLEKLRERILFWRR